MKYASIIVISFLLLLACNGPKEADTAIEEGLTAEANKEDLQEVSKSFASGEAKDAEEYFVGLFAQIVAVEVKYKEVSRLDEIDASAENIKKVLDEAKELIAESRAAIDIYTDRDWPLRAEFDVINYDWLNAIEGLMDNYLYALADPMSRLDETWTESELELYEAYLAAVKEYQEIDSHWITFQYEFAEANGFTLSSEPLDLEAIIDEEIQEDL